MSTAKNKADYKDFNYCAYTLAKLGKQMYDGKDREKSAIALIELQEGIERDGDFRTQYWLVPSIKAILGQHRYL